MLIKTILCAIMYTQSSVYVDIHTRVHYVWGLHALLVHSPFNLGIVLDCSLTLYVVCCSSLQM